jgi:FlaA1/EpsC-like NDP-sugar epimerase
MISLFKVIFPPSSFMPRWIIFLVDVLLCTLSYLLATFLRFNFFITEPFIGALLLPLPMVLVSRMVFMIQFRIYAGIIRHTSMEDALRVFYTILSSTALIIIENTIIGQVTHSKTSFIPLSILIIDSFLCLVLMCIFRFSSKIIFANIYKPGRTATTQFAIFGAGEAGMIVKQKLEIAGKIASDRHVAAFFDDDPRKQYAFMDGVTIFPFDTDIEEVARKHGITKLVISTNNISFSRRQKIIERCLELDIHVRNVPPSERWINGELSINQFKQVSIEDLIERDPIVLDKGAIAHQLFQKNILITGAAGTIGREIAFQIIKYYKPEKLILVDKSELKLYELEHAIEQSFKYNVGIELVVGDITNESRMRGIFQRYAPSIVYHAAAYKHVPLMEDNPSEAIWVNIGGTKLIADLSVEYGVDKFVMVSTDKAVNPTNVMGASKRIAEIYVQSINTKIHEDEYSSHTKFITTRFGNVLGSSGSVIPKFRQQIEEGGPITVTHPDITRYFMTIPEACQLVLEAGNMGNGGEIYIFDMGQSVKIIDLARKMIKLSGLQIGSDIQIVFTGLRPGEKLKEELLADQEKILPTYHPKIMISKVRTYEYDWVQKQIKMLIQMYEGQNGEHMVAKMKEIVPEFISQNSVFEELDYKLPKQEDTAIKHSYLG